MPETIPKSNARIWLLIGLAFSVFWVGYLAVLGPSRRAPLENSGMSEPASYDWSALDLDDRPVPFSKFQGKTLFLNIWATWCGPCVSEMPSIARLAENPRLVKMPIEFVCVSTDNSSEPVRQFIRGKNWRMTFLRAESLPHVFLTEGIPSTFLIGPDGKIAATEIGSADWDDPNVASFLEKLAAGQKDEGGKAKDH
jgi:thiol-disulfide isomerase/thioredoxin